ncbi:MAG: VanZ family protein [Candidatus Omnitrophota bacterium]
MNTQAASFARSWYPAILWMAFIFGLSSIPGSIIPKVPIPGISGIAHAIEYLILGILLLRGFRKSFSAKPLSILALLAASSAILFSFSDEWHQTFVAGRFCELEDLIVDAISAILGILLSIRKAWLPSTKD